MASRSRLPLRAPPVARRAPAGWVPPAACLRGVGHRGGKATSPTCRVGSVPLGAPGGACVPHRRAHLSPPVLAPSPVSFALTAARCVGEPPGPRLALIEGRPATRAPHCSPPIPRERRAGLSRAGDGACAVARVSTVRVGGQPARVARVRAAVSPCAALKKQSHPPGRASLGGDGDARASAQLRHGRRGGSRSRAGFGSALGSRAVAGSSLFVFASSRLVSFAKAGLLAI